MVASILAKLASKDVNTAPFSYATSDLSLDRPIYELLQSSFPPLHRFTRGLQSVASNQAVRLPARDIVENPEFSPEWQDFFDYHSSVDFWHELLRVFGDALVRTHPTLEAKAKKPLEKWSVGRRGTGGNPDIALDALFVINTPVTKASSVRPAHVDSEHEIWAGLLYMRGEKETAIGGDLALYSFKGKPAFGGHYAPLSTVNEEKLIPYAANRFIGFVNSASSIHGVTPRQPTQEHRRYINFIAVTPFKAFVLPMMSPWGQLRFWLERRKTKASGTMARPGRPSLR